jgi:fructose-bisphosphate aldolase class 1
MDGGRDKSQIEIKRKGDQRGGQKHCHLFSKANQRKRKKIVPCLEPEEVVIDEKDKMVNHALEFYKTLFGKERCNTPLSL